VLITRALTEPEPFAGRGDSTGSAQCRVARADPAPHPPHRCSIPATVRICDVRARQHLALGYRLPGEPGRQIMAYYKQECVRHGWDRRHQLCIARSSQWARTTRKRRCCGRSISPEMACPASSRGAAPLCRHVGTRADNYRNDAVWQNTARTRDRADSIGRTAGSAAAPDTVVQQFADFHAATARA